MLLIRWIKPSMRSSFCLQWWTECTGSGTDNCLTHSMSIREWGMCWGVCVCVYKLLFMAISSPLTGRPCHHHTVIPPIPLLFNNAIFYGHLMPQCKTLSSTTTKKSPNLWLIKWSFLALNRKVFMLSSGEYEYKSPALPQTSTSRRPREQDLVVLSG